MTGSPVVLADTITGPAPMTGSLAVVGLGPGPECWITPEARAALSTASDLVGYRPYLDRVPERIGQRRHGSDNRVEIARARHALTMAAEGRHVAVVSGGDPGVFAMAAAVFEAVDTGEPSWRSMNITVVPGISAMHAAAARLGAPLGHDFCAISLSDNLKPWEVVARRLRAAADGDFVIALFNPASKARPEKIHLAFALLRGCRSATTPVAFARAVGRPDERIVLTTLGDADPSIADMTTLVLIGSSETRFVDRPGRSPWLLTPRTYGAGRASPFRHPRARPGDPNQHHAAIDPRVEPGDDVESEKASPHRASPETRPDHDGDGQPSHPHDRQAPQTVRSPPVSVPETPA